MENRIESAFGKYAPRLQGFIDVNMQKFTEPFFPKYFSMGTPQMGLTYASIIGRARIEAAASIVAHGSEAPLRSRAGIDKLSGEVAAIKVKRPMDESDYRDLMSLKLLPIDDASKETSMLQLMFDDVRYVRESVVSRIDIMVAQALSTGKISINATTNPDGAVPGDIDLLVPSDRNNKGNEAFGWSAATSYWSAATGTPITDIRYLVERAWDNNGLVYDKILMTPSKWWDVQKTTEVKTAFDGIPTLDTFNSFMQANQLPIIELVKVRAKIEKDGVLTSVNTWEDNKYVTFVPDGMLGKIHNAFAIEQIAPVAGVNYATVGNVLISKWAQTEPFGEFTRGEIAAFPGLEVADVMHIVDVEAHA